MSVSGLKSSNVKPTLIRKVQLLTYECLTMNIRQRCSFRAPRQPRKPVTIVMPPAVRSRFAAERDGKDRGREENSDWVKESQTPTPNKPHPPSYTRNVIPK